MVTGFTAQEVVVETTGQIYVGVEEDEEGELAPTFLEDLNEIVVAFWEATVDTVKSNSISIIPTMNLTHQLPWR